MAQVEARLPLLLLLNLGQRILTQPLHFYSFHSPSPLLPLLPHASSSRRNFHFRLPALKSIDAPVPSRLVPDTDPPFDSEAKKSRNQLKREARRAVKWGMDLASFSLPQIKRILRVVSLDQQVFEALMLVKRLGPDVREGKRRQFNYIGKLLREVEPDLMDQLIKATKDADQKELDRLSGSVSNDLEDDDQLDQTSLEEDEEEADQCMALATRWFEGLINKDTRITNEVYSVQGVDFDRQELRKLVRRVHSSQEQQAINEEKAVNAGIIVAKKSLSRFLCSIAKQIPAEY